MKDYTIVMTSGTKFEITKDEYGRFNKTSKTTGKNFPTFQLDNGTSIFINHVDAIIPEEHMETLPRAERPGAFDPPEAPVPEPKKTREDVPTEVIMEQTEEEERVEKLAKSSCTHKDVTLHFQKTKKGTRYFPVCDFCGHRGRYIASESVTEAEALSALEWKES